MACLSEGDPTRVDTLWRLDAFAFFEGLKVFQRHQTLQHKALEDSRRKGAK